MNSNQISLSIQSQNPPFVTVSCVETEVAWSYSANMSFTTSNCSANHLNLRNNEPPNCLSNTSECQIQFPSELGGQVTANTLEIPIESNNTIKGTPSIHMDIEEDPSLPKMQSLEDKKQSKKVKKRKVLVVQPEEYLPDLLVELCDYHYKHTIRSGWKYQAQIPEQIGHQQRSYRLVNLWKASNDFNEQVFEEFKKMLGESRNEEQLCMIKLQLGCEWREVPRYLQANKQIYRRHFREKQKAIKLSRASSRE